MAFANDVRYPSLFLSAASFVAPRVLRRLRAMTSRELEEYKALRATIRDRGTARVWIFVVGLAVWGGLLLGTAVAVSGPVGTLLPLLVLVSVFEAVYALHTGVERIGRYVQVFHESDGIATTARWEHTAMAFGRADTRSGPDPLFAPVFVLAALCNFIPAILAGAVPVEWAVIGAVHLLFVGHVLLAKRRAAGQRRADLERFETLKNS